MLFSQIKTNISTNLDDIAGRFFNTADLDNSIQDAYDDAICLTRAIIKKVTLNFSTVPYYDFKALGVSDFMAVVAIYNNQTNRFLRDDVTIKHFDQIRDDWELWTGTPDYWAASNFKYTIIIPKQAVASGTFDLYYWATAPLVLPSDTPLLPTDLTKLIEFYSTPDLLEQAEEFTKANDYWETYFELIETAKDRFHNNARADLIRLR